MNEDRTMEFLIGTTLLTRLIIASCIECCLKDRQVLYQQNHYQLNINRIEKLLNIINLLFVEKMDGFRQSNLN